jgi:NADH-quinone oxidoreductase subunit I
MAVPDRKPLNFLESLYLWEVLKGLWITIGHVFRNIVYPKKQFRTIEYPDQRKPMPENYKGAHRLTLRPDGKVKCVACMCCPTVCPARCITIVAGEDPNDPIEKFPISFDIDMMRCIYCGFCVEACPKDAIRMDTGLYEISSFVRQDMIHNKAYMIELNKTAKVNLVEQVKQSSSQAEAFYRANPDKAADGFRQDEPAVIDPVDR